MPTCTQTSVRSDGRLYRSSLGWCCGWAGLAWHSGWPEMPHEPAAAALAATTPFSQFVTVTSQSISHTSHSVNQTHQSPITQLISHTKHSVDQPRQAPITESVTGTTQSISHTNDSVNQPHQVPVTESVTVIYQSIRHTNLSQSVRPGTSHWVSHSHQSLSHTRISVRSLHMQELKPCLMEVIWHVARSLLQPEEG